MSRLTEQEAEDLVYLWQSYAADLGIRSVHGAIERALLLRCPPRDLRRPVIEELERAGGRSPENRIVRLVTLERWGTKREIVQAIARLLADRRAEKIATERPETPATCGVLRTGRTCQHACAACEWTGFDLRLVDRRKATEPPTYESAQDRRARGWREQDEALESDHHQLAVKATSDATRTGRDELLGARKREKVERARSVLRKLSRFQVLILEQVYGGHWASEEPLILAVKAMCGGSRARALDAIEQACAAYRKARSSDDAS